MYYCLSCPIDNGTLVGAIGTCSFSAMAKPSLSTSGSPILFPSPSYLTAFIIHFKYFVLLLFLRSCYQKLSQLLWLLQTHPGRVLFSQFPCISCYLYREMLFVTHFLSPFYITSCMNTHDLFICFEIVIKQLMKANNILPCDLLI
ncbi:hypothetical protein CsSME_00033098 [Camellia sinensis var. sinensis]